MKKGGEVGRREVVRGKRWDGGGGGGGGGEIKWGWSLKGARYSYCSVVLRNAQILELLFYVRSISIQH